MNEHNTISKLGEKALIQMILEEIDVGDVLEGNEDCIGVLLNDDMLLVINIDTLYWPSDIPTKIQMTMRQGGRKTVMMTVSDLAAKGVSPKGFISSIGAPPQTLSTDFIEVVRGMQQGAMECGTRYLGGDLTESPHIIISGVSFGVVHPQQVMTRTKARPGDVVFITGEFLTGAGFKIAVDGLFAPKELYRQLIQSVIAPQARIKEGVTLGASGLATACIDSSDGLARSLYELSEASGVGIQIHHLPIAKPVKRFAELHNLNPESLTLYGGEEFELVFSAPAEKAFMVEKLFKQMNCTITQIGEVVTEQNILLGGEKIDSTGFEHFTSQSS